MESVDIFLVVVGVIVFGAGVWLFRRMGRRRSGPDGSPVEIKSTALVNLIVFAVLGAWCAGVILIGYGFGLGGIGRS